MKKKSKLLVGLAAILIVPILVNVLMLTSVERYVSVACSTNDWLTFFGGYSGSIVMALISLYILFENKKEQIHNNELAERQCQRTICVTDFHVIQEQVLDLVSDLGTGDFYLNPILPIDSPEWIEDMIIRLQKLKDLQLARKRKAFILFGNEQSQKALKFYSSYVDYLDSLIQFLDLCLTKLYMIRSGTSKERFSYEEFMKVINSLEPMRELITTYATEMLLEIREEKDLWQQNLVNNIYK